MSIPRRDPNYTMAQLQEEADRFQEAGIRYWEAMHKAGIGGAIAWVQGKEGLTLFTRGEYRDTLLRNVERIGPITHFGSASDE